MGFLLPVPGRGTFLRLNVGLWVLECTEPLYFHPCGVSVHARVFAACLPDLWYPVPDYPDLSGAGTTGANVTGIGMDFYSRFFDKGLGH